MDVTCWDLKWYYSYPGAILVYLRYTSMLIVIWFLCTFAKPQSLFIRGFSLLLIYRTVISCRTSLEALGRLKLIPCFPFPNIISNKGPLRSRSTFTKKSRSQVKLLKHKRTATKRYQIYMYYLPASLKLSVGKNSIYLMQFPVHVNNPEEIKLFSYHPIL